MNDHKNQVPIYFKSLELENVRCFAERQRLDLTDEHGKPVQWILILGDNGVGKTTLLQCLAWMRPVLSVQTFKVDDNIENDIYFSEPALNNEENNVWNSLIRSGAEVSVNLKATLSVGQALGSGRSESFNETVTTEASMTGVNGRLHDSDSRAHYLPDSLEEESLSDLAMFAYGATRRSGTLKVDRGVHGDALASLFRDATELYDAEDVLLKLDHRAAKPGELQDVERLARVKEIIAAVLPDIEHEGSIQILGPAMLSPSSAPGGVRFQTPYGLVPLSALSLAYQTTLTWVVDLALRLFERFPESPEPLSEPGIVLIDNIDLHLHPRWQRRVMENLSHCFPAIQFVATANSPLIVQAAEGATMAVLRKQDEQVVVETHLESVNAWRVDQILASDLFGIPTRSRSIERLIENRDDLLDKADRDDFDEKRLKSIEEMLEFLPTAEDPEDQAAMDLIRKVATNLRESGSHQP